MPDKKVSMAAACFLHHLCRVFEPGRARSMLAGLRCLQLGPLELLDVPPSAVLRVEARVSEADHLDADVQVAHEHEGQQAPVAVVVRQQPI